MKTPKQIRILLADDHLIVRMGISTIISLESDMDIIGEADDGMEAVRLADELNPDVIIMDILMPNVDGAEATRQILKKHPHAKILVLTTFSKALQVRMAITHGATSALLKDTSRTDFIDAIRCTAKGLRIISPEIAQEMSFAEGAPSLTRRQCAILTYVAKGFNNREIARFEGITPDGIRAHLKTIFTKLGVASRTEAATTAIAMKLIDA